MNMLSKMICEARGITPLNGEISGTCVYCGVETTSGHKFKPTGQFTTYQHIQGGTCICPECNVMKTSQDYRRSMWVVSVSNYTEFKSHEAKHMLQAPPTPPFAMYFTKTWKKQGWPQLMTRINDSVDYFVVGFDYELVVVDAHKRDEYLTFAQGLIDLGMNKTEMLTSRLKYKTYSKINFDLEIIDKLATLKNNPLWDLCVYVTRKNYDK